MPPSVESKRKKERACDACRKRKTKCDGPWVPNNICTNCLQTHKSCTYLEASKPRGPPKAYITGLEDRLEALESLVQKIRPDVDFSDELGPPVVRDSWKNQAQYLSATPTPTIINLASSSTLPPILIPQRPYHTHASLSSALASSISPCSTHLTSGPHSHAEPRSKKDSPTKPMNYRDTHKFSDGNSSSEYSSSTSDAEDTIVTSLVGRMKMTLKVAEQDSDPEDEGSIRFHGRISTAGLVEVARQFKHMHLQGSTDQGSPSSPDNSTVAQTRRPKFWRTTQWESVEDVDETQLPSFLSYFPPIELCRQLIELYFRHCNSLYPLLHRPTFDRQWSNGLYRRNIWFAAVCMLIFAVGSSWTDDERVLPPNVLSENGTRDWTQAGRHFFEAALDVHWLRRSYLHPSSLFEVQTFPLISIYLRGNSEVSASWMYVSLGLRKAQDIGAHRKKVYRDQINTDDELWKRAFWHLVVFDRMGSIYLGRPPCLGEEDFDLEFPLEVDDEYWETESDRFTQPPGIPSLVTAFNQIIRLSKISAFALRTLHAIEGAVVFTGVNTPTRAELGKQISQALQIWVDNIPEHLKWRSDFQNPIIAQQSSILFTSYHMTRILVHRCFILTPPTTSSQPQLGTFITDDASAVLCLDAVRASAHIIRNDRSKNITSLDTPFLGSVVHACGALLLVVIWSLKLQEKSLQSQGVYDIKPPVAQRMEWMLNDVQFFVDILEQLQKRWRICADMMSQLKSLLPRSYEYGKTQMGSVRSPMNSLVLDHTDNNFGPPSHLATAAPSTLPSPSIEYQPSVSLRTISSSHQRHEMKSHCSEDDLKASSNEREPAALQRRTESRKSFGMPKEQVPVYHGTHIDYASTTITAPPHHPFRSIDHEYTTRKIDNTTSSAFPYISNSMRRLPHVSSHSVDQEYARYPQTRISGIRSNIGDGSSLETQDLIGMDTDYTPISRHSRQYDHQPPAYLGPYPDYLQHTK